MTTILRPPTLSRWIWFIFGGVILFACGYLAGSRNSNVAYAKAPMQGHVPKSYGRLATALADSIGTGLVFEDDSGVVRFVSINGMKEGELQRY